MFKTFAALALLPLGACTLAPTSYDGDQHSYSHLAISATYRHIADYDGSLAQERGLAALVLIGRAVPDNTSF